MKFSVALLVTLSICRLSFASEDAYFFPLKGAESLHLEEALPSKVSAEELYLRTQEVFKEYSLPPEANYQEYISRISERSTPAEFTRYLNYFDTQKQFSRFFTIEGTKLSSFADRDAKRESDFSTAIYPIETAALAPVSDLASDKRPLAGLRIALDPGHMGSDYWDKETGKYVQDSHGHTVSEGEINLQTCLLLKTQFEALGASVMITREELRPVSDKKPSEIDFEKFAREEFRMRSLEDWFQKLINLPSREDVTAAFKSDPTVKSVFSEAHQRMNYFIFREELDARAEKIAEFDPDLTLVVHFDASNSHVGPIQSSLAADNPPDLTRAYVAGAFEASDFATSQSRAQMVAHLMKSEQLRKSVEISKSIVSQISSQLKIPVRDHDMEHTVPIVPGVFARNLVLTRKVTSGMISYLECLMYGNLAEFNMLIEHDYTQVIGGKTYFYSKRLKALSEAIRDGVVSYYQQHRQI